MGWPVDRWEDVKKENKKHIRVRESLYNGLCKGSGSFVVNYSGDKRVGLVSVSRQGTKVDSGIFDGSGGECVCICCVNSAAGRQGSGGGNYSTAGAEQTGRARLAHGTESTQPYSGQFSWQLTTVRKAVVTENYKENKYRCVTNMRNLNRTALSLNVFSSYSDRYLYIVCCLEFRRIVISSTRIHIGLFLLFVGVEEQRHV